MSDLGMLDAIDVQDIYVTGAMFEDAGDGQMRIIRYVKHGATVVPLFSYVTPAVSMMRDAYAAIEFATSILRGGGWGH